MSPKRLSIQTPVETVDRARNHADSTFSSATNVKNYANREIFLVSNEEQDPTGNQTQEDDQIDRLFQMKHFYTHGRGHDFTRYFETTKGSPRLKRKSEDG